MGRQLGLFEAVPTRTDVATDEIRRLVPAREDRRGLENALQ